MFSGHGTITTRVTVCQVCQWLSTSREESWPTPLPLVAPIICWWVTSLHTPSWFSVALSPHCFASSLSAFSLLCDVWWSCLSHCPLEPSCNKLLLRLSTVLEWSGSYRGQFLCIRKFMSFRAKFCWEEAVLVVFMTLLWGDWRVLQCVCFYCCGYSFDFLFLFVSNIFMSITITSLVLVFLPVCGFDLSVVQGECGNFMKTSLICLYEFDDAVSRWTGENEWMWIFWLAPFHPHPLFVLVY